MNVPELIPNWIDNAPRSAESTLDKLSPVSGKLLWRVSASGTTEVDTAVRAARAAQPGWAAMTPPARGALLHDLALAMRADRQRIAAIVAAETGKSMKDALGETDGAVALGLFMAGEGTRLYGRTATSGVPNRMAMTVRQPVGVAGLIIAANTPVANVAWKIFPALVCGNTAVLKAAEDTPATAWVVGELAAKIGLPAGVLSIIQGLGTHAGAALVEHRDVDVVSFTGSTRVGKQIAEVCARRMARVSLELGGKNPLVVCDDADVDNAVKWTLLSAFSNAGQRCAAASRCIVDAAIYDTFRERLVTATKALKVGPDDTDDLGPVINQRQLDAMVAAVDQARSEGALILTGGVRLGDQGFFMAPTVIENVAPQAAISTTELFGPVLCLYKVSGFSEALALANASPYGLTASIHTRNVSRALAFSQAVEAGVAVVNAGTYGSEPHMPFGGWKQSGNGTREPGTEALDVYCHLKNILLNVDPGQL